MLCTGRKREFEGEVPPGDMGGGPGDDGFRKKPRFDEQGGTGDEEEVLPATLRVLIRNSDAGGIIGKVREDCYRV